MSKAVQSFSKDVSLDDVFEKNLTQEDIEIAAELLGMYVYKGFDPVETRKAFIAACIAIKKPPREALLDIITYYLSRGTKLPGVHRKKKDPKSGLMVNAKGVTGIGKNALNRMNGLRTKLKIRANTEVGSDSKTLSIGRIIASSAGMVAKVIARMKSAGVSIRVIVPKIPAGLPIFMCFPQAASLLPRDDSEQSIALNNAFKEFYDMNDFIINNKNVSENRDQFYDIIKNSNLYSDDQRKAIRDECSRLIMDVEDVAAKSAFEKGAKQAGDSTSFAKPGNQSEMDATDEDVIADDFGSKGEEFDADDESSSSDDGIIKLKSTVLGSCFGKSKKSIFGPDSTFSSILVANAWNKKDTVTAYYKDVMDKIVDQNNATTAVFNEDILKRHTGDKMNGFTM